MKRGIGIRRYLTIGHVTAYLLYVKECIELCDSVYMHALNILGSATGHDWQEKDSLFIKIQGHSADSLREGTRVVSDIMNEYGATNLVCAKNDKEADDIWTDRRNALYAGLALAGDARAQGLPTDVWY